jgi:hypothetical protein
MLASLQSIAPRFKKKKIKGKYFIKCCIAMVDREDV